MIDPLIVGWLMIVVMLLLLLSGMPIAFALATAGVMGLAATRPWPSVEFLLASFPYTRSANLAYIVLPAARSSPVSSTTRALTTRPPSSIRCRVRLRRATCQSRISCRALAAW